MKPNRTDSLFSFIRECPTAYHTVEAVKRRLLAAGYAEFSLGDDCKPSAGGKYFTVKNGSSLVAFRKGGNEGLGFLAVASHGDSPTFRVKREAKSGGSYAQIAVERYGGMIYYSWLDRPLSVAGRVLIRTPDGLSARLVKIDRDLFVIPSVAIHQNREINESLKLNPAVDMIPLYGNADCKPIETLLAEEIGCKPDEIVSHDLFLFVREEGRRFGVDGEFLLSPRLDDLECVFASLEGFLGTKAGGATTVFALFDNEEVGSETRQGAASTFFSDVLTVAAGSAERYRAALDRSLLISADNAHAIHPNHPEYADGKTPAPILNGGVVVKYNAAQHYATDGYSDAILREIARRADLKLQTYYNRADIAGGSTLGSIADTRVPMPTVDIGLPQLAMHAAVETAGAADLDDAVKLFTVFYETRFRVGAEGVEF